jgi:phospholipid/cholesterol/gamma-HCH transport system substrate-binding protein
MKKSRHDIWVGLLVLIGAGAILFLALKAANLLTLNFGQTYPIKVEFNNIGGLKPRAAVKSAGVVVGRVESVDLDNEKFVALVTVQMERKFQFPKDSMAKILTSGLLGEQYVGFEPGMSTEMMKPGTRITQTQGAVVLEDIIGQFLYNKAAEPAGVAGGKK